VTQAPVTLQVLQELRRMITSGELPGGTQVVQDALATQLGVSRVPLREALKVLEGEGHVTYFPHRGYFVTELTVADLVEAYRLRALLEAEAITEAVARLDDEEVAHIDAMRAEVEAASVRGDVAEINEANRMFHFALFELCAMPRLVRMIAQLWDATDAYRSVYMSSTSNLAHMAREHAAMMTALRARDAATVVALQAEHRENSVTIVTKSLAPR
jgi:DNA-binding GntR family transcriptional regulator